MDQDLRSHPPSCLSSSPDSHALLAGTLAHMARYLTLHCPLAAQRSTLLLDRLEEAATLPVDLLDACRELQEALWPPGTLTFRGATRTDGTALAPFDDLASTHKAIA